MFASSATESAMLRCDMCHKPLKSKRFQISVFMRPERTMTVGPDCYKKEKKAVEAMKQRFTAEELDAKRADIAAKDRAA
jgi:ribosome-binding protein aMBF1 (putative translation factor)